MFVDLNKIDRKLSSSEQKIVMLSYYEQLAGIRNHEAAGTDPTTLIAFNKSEDPLYFDPAYDKIDLYFTSKINRYANMSLEQFMELDSEYADYIAAKCRREATEDGRRAGNLAQELDDIIKPT